jgi:transcriptional regulator with XRE-family HTH domain
MSIQELKNKALGNPEVKFEYEQLDAEFALIDALITMRKKSGLTQEQIAKKLDTRKSNISRLERGNTNPSWRTLGNYAKACGFKISMQVKESVKQ